MLLVSSQKDIECFQRYIFGWFDTYGRKQLPWRKDFSPYFVLVSELMLQQTQVERVIPKFNSFVNRFPTINSLSQAPLSSVLAEWQGLGYNRRAKFLLACAKQIVESFEGEFPTTESELLALPGIGPYTASAIQAFSFNQHTIMIETNIRTVFLYHFFPQIENVDDQDLKVLISRTLPPHKSRIWYSALMDYGTVLKQIFPNPSRKSKHYTTQSKFQGSSRQVRGEVIKVLTQYGILTKSELEKKLTSNKIYFSRVVSELAVEGLIVNDGKYLSLAS